MAEIFLILLFLMLLTMVSYGALVEQRMDNIQESLDVSQTSVRRLTNVNNELRRLNAKRYGALDLSREIVEIKADMQEMQHQFNQVSQHAQDLKVSLANEQQKSQVADNVLTLLRQEQENLSYEDMPKYIGKLHKNLRVTRKTINDTQTEITKVKYKLFSMSKRAGIDNFCWYEEVIGQNGLIREKGLKIFDIRIWNKKIEVALAHNWQEQAEQYQSRFDELPIDASTTHAYYADQEFVTHFLPLYEHGIRGLVHGQPAECRFQVWVWDNTGKRNKPGFKQKMRLVEGYFYKLNVIDEKWPHPAI